MLVNDFKNKVNEYKNFEVWEVSGMNDFFKGNTILKTIFETDYKIKLSDFFSKRHEIQETDLAIMHKLLDQVGDKHFYIFTLLDPNHLELIQIQDMKLMDFGMDIAEIKNNCVYIMIMDKVKSETPFF
ncbi:MAG: hypothetical protein IPM77_14705 [Crocinitomicaceae bacterium]|nr:hypothetical protein [Crocinitomicaceae bacterium]